MTLAPNKAAAAQKRQSDVHPLEKEREKFANLMVAKGMSNEDYLGVMLRDDLFLNMMSTEPHVDIKKIWCEMLGKPVIE